MPAFLDGGGECGALIGERDWSATLGEVHNWPQSLKAACGLMLRSPVPMVMLWGDEGIMLYNDAYSVFAGRRHPQLLGSRVREGWPEVADFNDHVMKVGLGGGTLSFRDQELVLYRNGRAEKVAMNLDYSPVIGDDGHPQGVLAVVIETTARLAAERELKCRAERLTFFDRLSETIKDLVDPREIMAVTARLLGEYLHASVVAYADMEEDENVFNITGDWAAEGSRSIVGRYSLADFGPTAFNRLKEGRPFITRDSLTELGPEEARALLELGLGATVCFPYRRGGRLVALMAVHQKEPRDWSDDDLRTIEEATERSWAHVVRVRSEARLLEAIEQVRRSEEQLRALIEQLPIGVAVAHLPGGEIFLYNQALETMLGHPILSEGKETYVRYGGIDEQGNSVALERYPLYRAVAFGETVRGDEMRYLRPDGRIITLLGNAAPIAVGDEGTADLAVVTLQDISDRKQAEAHQQLLINELSHRAKNLLAIIQSIAQQSFKGDGTPKEQLARFEGRLGALSAAHGILTQERWEAVPLRRLICDTFGALRHDDNRLTLDGPDLMLPPKVAVSIAMAIHELATNALKYGSLTCPSGTVAIHWQASEGRLRLSWKEQGGPPVTEPARRGFGSRMIERGLSAELGGSVTISFEPDGVLCEVDAPMPGHG
jgi:PAS domain S-box-containing protein